MAGIERRLVDRVGSFLRNVERTPGVTCGVCTAPTDGGTECSRCRHDRERFGELLADLVVPVAYGGHNDQSRTLLHGYKDEVAAQPGDERRLLVLLLLWVAVQRHRRCIERRVQAPLQLWTTVPSTKGREHHPLRDIARRAGLGKGEVVATPADLQPSDSRLTAPGRFSLRPASLGGAHLVIVDDTWTSGGHAQSLALTARAAGAARVTIVVLARWLKPDWPPTAAYLSSHPHRDFDPLTCPVTGGRCP